MALLAIATLSFVTALCVYGIATVLFISSAPPVIWYAMALLIRPHQDLFWFSECFLRFSRIQKLCSPQHVSI